MPLICPFVLLALGILGTGLLVVPVLGRVGGVLRFVGVRLAGHLAAKALEAGVLILYRDLSGYRRLTRATSTIWPFDGRCVVSGSILNSKGLRVGVENGASIFDLSGKKVYDLKGINIYRLSGELVGHLIDARGSDKRLDHDSEGLLSVQGRPEPDKPETSLGPQRQLSDSSAEAMRLRQMISDTLSDHPGHPKRG